jgi:hypothetical protein
MKLMGTIREIHCRQIRDWSKWEGYRPAERRAEVELDRGDRVTVSAEAHMQVGSRVGLIYVGSGFIVNEVLLF